MKAQHTGRVWWRVWICTCYGKMGRSRQVFSVVDNPVTVLPWASLLACGQPFMWAVSVSLLSMVSPSTACSNFANPSSRCSCLQSRLQKSPSSPSLCLHVHNIWANWYWTNPWQNQSTLIAGCVSHIGLHQLYTEQFDQHCDEPLWHYVQHIVMLSSYTLLTVDLHQGTWLLGVHVTQYAFIFSLDESTILQSIHLCHMRSRIDSNYLLNLCQYSPACPCADPSLAARRGCWVCLLHCSYVHLVFH